MFPLIAERIRDRIADAHLKPKRVAILWGEPFACQHGDARCAPCECGEPDIQPYRRDMMNFDRHNPRRQSLAPPGKSRDCVAALLRMKQDAGVVPACRGKCLEK